MNTRGTVGPDDVLALIAALVRDGRPATAADLASVLGCSASTLQRRIDTLQRDGRVEFELGPRRQHLYRPAEGAQPGAAPEPPIDRQAAAPGPPAPPPLPLQPPRPPSPPPPPPAGNDLPPEPPGTDKPPAPAAVDQDFRARDLDRMVISLPLQQMLDMWQQAQEAQAPQQDPRWAQVKSRTRVFGDRFSVIIDLNTGHLGGVQAARQRVLDLLLLVALRSDPAADGSTLLTTVAPRAVRELSNQYVVARLRPAQIKALVELDQRDDSLHDVGKARLHRAIFRIWPDNVVQRHSSSLSSLPTIKVDAARNSFGCSGRGIVWAVVDSGIDGNHQHFAAHRNLLDLPPNVAHMDFVDPAQPQPLVDAFGHGTHVAGIVAGGVQHSNARQPVAVMFERDQNGARRSSAVPLDEASGVAPQCKLVSYKVLDGAGQGGVVEIMAALEHVHRINGYGKAIVIHGINLSLGYRYDPQWFACGHSPLCEVVDRVARSGVCVVVAAGNSGYGEMDTLLAGARAQGMPMSINDPGNAERAITVGSTHRDAPHTYGVSYFSSKGPTGDGRAKPDLLAPGEKIISCLSTAKAGALPNAAPAEAALRYVEDSGTSMAAPHVSGAIAALLSVRREFIGRSDDIKRILMASALDLGRERSMQGSGLLNLFSALQSI